ncbi:MAG: S41 family peptidase [Candidatus Hydrogenedentes bacterium]|nr:S41 family peptidase [Candidatus Hydrogenedentota bacterium]
MRKRNSKYEFITLFLFMVAGMLVLTNGFVGRISAQGNEVDVYQKIEPIGVVLDTVLQEYVREADVDKLVEGALLGMMSALDKHSSFITAQDLAVMREETKGEFEGIGVSIKLDEDENIVVFQPIPESPAAQAGLKPFDIIAKIDDAPTIGMTLADAADKIRGPRGTTVKITVLRPQEDKETEPELLDFVVKRDKVPLDSVKEARLFEGDYGKIGYVRVSDFKDTTARDVEKALKEFIGQGMDGFVLDLRWNPGGLLTASQEVSQLFLPRNSLVTYTKGREKDGKSNGDDMELYTEGNPVLPEGFPMIILVNEQTASSSEIVTGSLQFHQRAIILGEKTYGKGSVQTIIPLQRPQDTALRLTTALYYTPADVTIDGQGILPDVEVDMDWDTEKALGMQMYKSYENDPGLMNKQNHGLTGEGEGDDPVVVDSQLQQALTILGEDKVWDNLLKKYHRDVRETQLTASAAAKKNGEGHEDTSLKEEVIQEQLQQEGTDQVVVPEGDTEPVELEQ